MSLSAFCGIPQHCTMRGRGSNVRIGQKTGWNVIHDRRSSAFNVFVLDSRMAKQQLQKWELKFATTGAIGRDLPSRSPTAPLRPSTTMRTSPTTSTSMNTWRPPTGYHLSMPYVLTRRIMRLHTISHIQFAWQAWHWVPFAWQAWHLDIHLRFTWQAWHKLDIHLRFTWQA